MTKNAPKTVASKPVTPEGKAALKLKQDSLMNAVKFGHVARVRDLLAEGVSPRFKQDRHTPLHAAAEIGSLEMIDLLLEAGADIEAKGRFNWTPLHWCASGDMALVARHLLSRGADLNAENVDLDTPLHRAVQLDAVNCVALFLRAGADLERINNRYKSARVLAEKRPEAQAVIKSWFAQKAAIAALDEINKPTAAGKIKP